MSHFVVDIEADGGIPGDYSMICLGAVLVDDEGLLNETFYGTYRPISDIWVPEALAVSGFSREETLGFADPQTTTRSFASWVEDHNRNGRPQFWADNNGFDWMFSHWYMVHFTGDDPFGFSSKNLNSLYHGIQRDIYKSFKHLRKTTHTHNPVDDAKGNAEALLAMRDMGVKISL